MSDEIKPDELLDKVDYKAPTNDWMSTSSVQIRPGMYCYSANPKSMDTLSMPHSRKWDPLAEDWLLPENWQEIIHEGLKTRLEKFRTFRVFMNILVRC